MFVCGVCNGDLPRCFLTDAMAYGDYIGYLDFMAAWKDPFVCSGKDDGGSGCLFAVKLRDGGIFLVTKGRGDRNCNYQGIVTVWSFAVFKGILGGILHVLYQSFYHRTGIYRGIAKP